MNEYPEIPLKLHCTKSDFRQKLKSIAPICPEVFSRTLETIRLEGNRMEIHFSLPLDRAIELLGKDAEVDFRAEDWVKPEPSFSIELQFPPSLLYPLVTLIFSRKQSIQSLDTLENPARMTAFLDLRLILEIAKCQQQYDYTIALAQEKRGPETALCVLHNKS